MIITPRTPTHLFNTSYKGEVALASTYSIEREQGKESRCSRTINYRPEDFDITMVRLPNPERNPLVDLRRAYPTIMADHPDLSECLALLKIALDKTTLDREARNF